MKAWVLKIRRYTGGESVVWDYDTEAEAQAEADLRNAEYQSDSYYVEKWEPAKTVWPKLPRRPSREP